MKTITSLFASLIFLLPAAVLAQGDDDVVEITLEAYLVDIVTGDDGNQTEVFVEADAARPGQMVEYRVLVLNTSSETLPAEAVVVTGPLPPQTLYLEGSATESDDVVRTEFSVDGATFSQPPITITITDADGGKQEVLAEPASYTAVRWTLLEPLGPQQSRTFVYRAEVR